MIRGFNSSPLKDQRAPVSSSRSQDFYASLIPYHRFSELTESRHYRKVPSDWWVVITDVKGSTEALENNRYKDVNLLGASSIMAVLNVLKGQEVPFVFGGDGATLLVHDSDIEKIKPALLGTKRLARDVLEFEIRIGLVPVRILEEGGLSVEVAKFAISDKSAIATLRGGGLNRAETLIKDPSPENQKYRLEFNGTMEPDVTSFEGLSCRWNPVKARRGEIMSLLVKALRQNNSDLVYERIIQKLESILLVPPSLPATPDKFRTTNIAGLFKEARIHTIGQPASVKVRRFLRILYEVAIMRSFMIFGLTANGFNARTYIQEMGENTDFQKFDDMIRMVRDCTIEQRDQIFKVLEEERAGGDIAYGIHMSNEAMITCLVFQLDNHIHFIDGSRGGYAVAAKQLKEQLRQSGVLKKIDGP